MGATALVILDVIMTRGSRRLTGIQSIFLDIRHTDLRSLRQLCSSGTYDFHKNLRYRTVCTVTPDLPLL